MISLNRDIFHKNVAVAENDSNDIREETASEESHHDGIYKGEVPS
jgi:hypothetical protein